MLPPVCQGVPFRPTMLALLCSLAMTAQAATVTNSQDATAKQGDGTLQLSDVNIAAQSLTAAPSLPPVYAGGQVARGAQMGVLGNQDIMDTPFTSTAYTSELIENQQAENIGDVLLNDSSVRQASGYGNQSQVFMIRGLPLATDDISFNGLYGMLPRQIISTDGIERVEVFRGPSAFTNGITPTGTGLGGSVNLQPKRADDTPLRRLTTDISDNGRVGEHLDLGQRFGEDNQFGARVNLAQRSGNTGVDHESQSEQVFTAGLDYRGDKLRLSADFGYQKEAIDGGRNSVFLGSATKAPKAPSSTSNANAKWANTTLEDTYGMLRGEYDLNDNWTAYAAGGYKHTRENGRYSSVTLTDNVGDANVTGSTIPHDEDNTSFSAGLNGTFQTGAVSHRLNLGMADIWAQQRSAYDFDLSGEASNIYHPVATAKPSYDYPGGDLSDPGITGKTFNRSLAASDTVGLLDDRVLVTAGLRRQQLVVEGYDYNSGARDANYDKEITTPVFGLVIKPWEHVSFYANRIEGLAAGDTAPDTASNRGQTFAPGRTKQVEAGVKVDMGTYGATLGVYRIEEPTAGYTNSALLYVQDGTQINKGVEFNAFGEPVQGLRILGGVTVMKTRVEDTQNGTNDGNRAIGVPTFQLNAGIDWDVPGLEGVSLNGRMLRTGGQYADAANTISLPTWNRFDAGARYGFKVDERDVTLRATMENVFNKDYWASAQGGYLTQGEPRVVKLSATVDF
ncbi:TonB-dependent siderophore receptor [Pseudomonas sp. App30]|uniref:TonB-dependent receptor n=1 Tax=Pseudomonas sp. App30 TaxID=3068990 RepID=UPI003A80B9AC